MLQLLVAESVAVCLLLVLKDGSCPDYFVPQIMGHSRQNADAVKGRCQVLQDQGYLVTGVTAVDRIVHLQPMFILMAWYLFHNKAILMLLSAVLLLIFVL